MVSLKSTILVLIFFVLMPACQSRPRAGGQPKLVFRAPFVLKLRIDSQHYYEQKFGKIPYVSDGDVYLFGGEDVGVNVAVRGGRVSRVTYQPNTAAADVAFSFFQQPRARGVGMNLVIQNRLKRRLYLDALMTILGKSGTFKTDILPIPPGLTDYESWPYPIGQLVLRNFRFTAKESEVVEGSEQ